MTERSNDQIRGAGQTLARPDRRSSLVGAQGENADFYRILFDSAAVGIAVAEVETKRFLLANPNFCRMLGYSQEELCSLVIEDIHPTERLREVLDEFHALASGSKVLATDIPCRRRDGTLLHADISTSQVMIDGKLCNVGFFSDVTARKQTESQIAQLNELKERLIGDLSLREKFALVTDGIVEIFGADFARIWQIRVGDLCDKDCIHAVFRRERPSCCGNPRCLHLEASSGRYTHIDGDHRRVPFGSYKIGRIASGEESRFLTNEVTRDSRIHNREWAQELGLVAFAGYRLLSPDGAPIGVLALFSKRTISPVEDGLLASLASYVSQLILSERAREKLLNSEIKFRMLFENANDAIFLLHRGQFVDCNDRALQMFHCSREQIIGQPPHRFSPPLQPDGRDSQEKAIEKIRAALDGTPQFFEWKHCFHDGTSFDAEVGLNRIALGEELFIQGIVRDISERKQWEEELHTLSIRDELTGLYNRRGFSMLAEQQLKLAARNKKGLILLYIDLDNLKGINDRLGHQGGDEAIKHVAAILGRTFRESDIISRQGGDEFAALVIDTTLAVDKCTARLHQALDSHNCAETRRYELSLSLGIAHFDPGNPCSLEELVGRADKRMYEEKRKKQGRR